MRFPGSTRLFALTGLMTLCAFAGDIVADSLADACGEHCISQSSQSNSQDEKAPCSHCSCAVHNGSVIASSSVVQIIGVFNATAFVLTVERSGPDGIPRAIDHPPQLA
jgi:hypothetical protein